MPNISVNSRRKLIFTYTELNGKCHSNLALTEIIDLVWCWVHIIPVHNAVLWTGRNKSTVIDWYNLCRDVVVVQFQKDQKWEVLVTLYR